VGRIERIVEVKDPCVCLAEVLAYHRIRLGQVRQADNADSLDRIVELPLVSAKTDKMIGAGLWQTNGNLKKMRIA
jgi:hypothetical protein